MSTQWWHISQRQHNDRRARCNSCDQYTGWVSSNTKVRAYLCEDCHNKGLESNHYWSHLGHIWRRCAICRSDDKWGEGHEVYDNEKLICRDCNNRMLGQSRDGDRYIYSRITRCPDCNHVCVEKRKTEGVNSHNTVLVRDCQVCNMRKFPNCLGCGVASSWGNPSEMDYWICDGCSGLRTYLSYRGMSANLEIASVGKMLYDIKQLKKGYKRNGNQRNKNNKRSTPITVGLHRGTKEQENQSGRCKCHNRSGKSDYKISKT